jgi:hypothetical protein
MWRVPYLLYSVVVLVMLAFAEYRGWWITSVSRNTDVPRSLRANPGAYRPVYGGIRRYPGGK